MLTKLKKLSLLLASQVLLTGCALIPQSAQTVPELIAADKLCQSWRHLQLRPQDFQSMTDETAQEIEGNNKARVPWGCQYGDNSAAPKG